MDAGIEEISWCDMYQQSMKVIYNLLLLRSK